MAREPASPKRHYPTTRKSRCAGRISSSVAMQDQRTCTAASERASRSNALRHCWRVGDTTVSPDRWSSTPCGGAATWRTRRSLQPLKPPVRDQRHSLSASTPSVEAHLIALCGAKSPSAARHSKPAATVNPRAIASLAPFAVDAVLSFVVNYPLPRAPSARCPAQQRGVAVVTCP